MLDKLNLQLATKTVIKTRAILTSYEMVWATARTAPSKAYFELEDQPDKRTVYTFKLETHKKNSNPSLKGATPWLDVYKDHNLSITTIAIIGLII